MNDASSNPNADAEAILKAAMGFSVAERAAYLAGACGNNAALREKVEAMILAREAPTVVIPKHPPGTILVSFTDETAGSVIGRYKLLQQIGEGGCGAVYMAEQSEPVRRRVALKVIKLGMDTKQVIARFEAERQALALMDHPNIAKVFDAGATETGRPYFVMELVKGIPITQFCDDNHLNTETRLRIFVQVCQAIQHAHQKGIIHRDIKPSNILVADHDGVPVPKIIDFGIAKATTDQRLTDKTLFTAFEQFIGTPAYMSPEQAKLSGLDIDTRSDIYSLGVLLYELLMGKTPFEARSLLEAGLDEIRRIIREEEPVRPSTRLKTLDLAERTSVAKQRQADAPKLHHLIRGDLDWIVMKCLEKDRGRRYETANGLALDVQRYLNNEPVLASPPGNIYRFQKMVRRHRFGVAAAGAVAVALIIGLVVSSYMFVREKAALAREETARGQAEAASKQARTEMTHAQESYREARAAEQNVKATLSASEFLQGSRALSEGHPGDALAYLARSYSDDPANEAALTTMATLLASHSWMVPTVLIKANSAQFSPDGKRIVTASDDGTARIWDAQTGEPVTPVMQHGHKVVSAEFSADGTRIVTASWDEARIWDAKTGQPLTPPMQQDGLLTSAQFSPDGTRILTVHGAAVIAWDAQTGKQVAELRRHAMAVVNSAEFSPDGKRVVTAAGTAARVWDIETGRPLTEAMIHNGVVGIAHYSPDGKFIVTTARDGTARIWDAHSGKQLAELLKRNAVVSSVQFSPDSARIATATRGGVVSIWDAQTGKSLPGPPSQDNRVNAVQFSPDGKRIITASGITARIWAADGGKPLTEPLLHGGPVTSVQFSPDGKRILTVSREGTARVWDVQNSLPPLTEILRHDARVNSVQFSPDGKKVVTASDDATVRVWDARTGQPLTEPMKHGFSVLTAEFSSDGKRIVTMSRDRCAQVWDAVTGKAVTEPLVQPANLSCAHFSPDGKKIIIALWDGSTRLWDSETGKLLMEPLKQRSRIRSAQFSPDGRRIVTASADGTARIWDAQAGRQLTELQHGSLVGVSSAQFSPDGARILTVSRDGTAPIWDAATGQQLAQIGGDITTALYSPDGKRIVTVSGNTARIWDAQNGQPLTEPLQNNSFIYSAQFSPDGKRIVTATVAGGARVWDAQTGQQLAEPFSVTAPARPNENIRAQNAPGGPPPRAAVNTAQFSPDGKRIIAATEDDSARIWDIAPSQENRPAWLPQLAEAISGQSLNKQGLLEPTKLNCADILNKLRQDLGVNHTDDDWVTWGRWFLADPFTRTISPFSEQTVPQYVENRIAEGTEESLDEAERLATNDSRLLKLVADARVALREPSQTALLRNEGAALMAQGKLEEAGAKYADALSVGSKVKHPDTADTLTAMKKLADADCAAGLGKEGIAVLAKVCNADPADTDLSLTMAIWQRWFGQDSDYETTSRRLIEQAEGTDQAGTAERAAKSACLGHITDTVLLAKSLALAQKGVELGKDSEYLPWYQLTLGMAQYRNGQFPTAEESLTVADQTVGNEHPDIQGIARLFRVMSLIREGKSDEGRKLFSQEEPKVPPLPKDENKPLVDGNLASHDVMLWWMAYKEAKSVIAEPAPK